MGCGSSSTATPATTEFAPVACEVRNEEGRLRNDAADPAASRSADLPRAASAVMTSADTSVSTLDEYGCPNASTDVVGTPKGKFPRERRLNPRTLLPVAGTMRSPTPQRTTLLTRGPATLPAAALASEEVAGWSDLVTHAERRGSSCDDLASFRGSSIDSSHTRSISVSHTPNDCLALTREPSLMHLEKAPSM